MLDEHRVLQSAGQVTPNRYFYQSKSYQRALALRDRILHGQDVEGLQRHELPESLESGVLAMLLLQSCQDYHDPDLLLDSMLKVAVDTIPYLSPGELRPLWARLRAQPCFHELDAHDRAWFALFEQLSARDGLAVAQTARGLLETGLDRGKASRYGYLITAAMLGYLSVDQHREALDIWHTYAPQLLRGNKPNIFLELLYFTALSSQ